MISVKQLNETFPGQRFYRLTNDEERHRGFQYTTGLNIDTTPFNSSGKCEKGGLYFLAKVSWSLMLIILIMLIILEE